MSRRSRRQTTGASPQPAPQRALQAALAAEHAAVYGYGIVGARLSGARGKRAREAWNAHRSARDRLRERVRQAGATPTPAAPAYGLPHRVTGTETAVRLAVHLEDRVAGAYLELVAAGDEDQRRFAAAATQECAVRAAHWRGSSVAFPGLPEDFGRASGPRETR